MQPFSYEQFGHFFSEFRRRGFEITSFAKFSPTNEKTVILRHDVDYTLDGVVDLASIERDIGATATYMFRVHADEYNVFSCTGYRVIESLRSMGHEIGLHFEAMNIGRALKIEPDELLLREKKTLEAIIGAPVVTCSEHRELSSQIHQTPIFDSLFNPLDFGFTNYAMAPKYAKEMKYLSDSNAVWREGDPLHHIDKHNRFQILIHPDWWFESDLLLKGRYVHPKGRKP